MPDQQVVLKRPIKILTFSMSRTSRRMQTFTASKQSLREVLTNTYPVLLAILQTIPCLKPFEDQFIVITILVINSASGVFEIVAL